MRVYTHQKSIFDTRLDTNKLFVPMRHLFYPHNHINKQGKSLLYVKFSERGSNPVKIDLDLYIIPKHWNKLTQRVTKEHPNYEDINLILDNIENKITTIKTFFRLSEKYMTLTAFLEEYKNGTERIDFCRYMKNEIENQYNDGRIKFNTRKKERSVCKKLMEFREKILFQDLTEDVIQKFVQHRRKSLKKTSVNSNLKIIKKYIIDAKERGINMPLKIANIKIGSTDGNKESLTEIEYKKFKGYFYSDYLKDTHKIPLANFLLSCATGLRISDVQGLEESSINNDIIIIQSAVKTGKFQKIKLTPVAIAIIEKCPEILTVKISDQYTNRLLKEICKLLGVRKAVTFHHARHTFATRILRKGGRPEVLQKQLNHSTIRETMNYVTILQQEQDDQIMLLDD